jgi:MTH538 TIR-like domain (DUF1863)
MTMAREPVFYSFHFDNDAFRVQLVRNMGVVEGDEPVSPNDWEEVKRKGSASIEKWIDEKMKYKRCVIVLIGSETADRTWVKYEIKRAWNTRKGLLGIHIHNLKCARTRSFCAKGRNPFGDFSVGNTSMAKLIACYDPDPQSAYGDIAENLERWVRDAISQAQRR